MAVLFQEFYLNQVDTKYMPYYKKVIFNYKWIESLKNNQ